MAAIISALPSVPNPNVGLTATVNKGDYRIQQVAAYSNKNTAQGTHQESIRIGQFLLGKVAVAVRGIVGEAKVERSRHDFPMICEPLSYSGIPS